MDGSKKKHQQKSNEGMQSAADSLGLKTSHSMVSAMTSPSLLWNYAVRSISQQKERPSPKSVTDPLPVPLDSLPEGVVKLIDKKNNESRNGNKGRREAVDADSVSQSSSNSSVGASEPTAEATPKPDSKRQGKPGTDPLRKRASSPSAASTRSRNSMESSNRYTPKPYYNAASRGARMKIPQSYGKKVPTQKSDEKTKAVLGNVNDFDASALEIPNIVNSIFAPNSGISDDEVRNAIKVRVSSKQMEPEQQIAAANKVIKRLKDTLTDLMRGKNDLIAQATLAEKNARNGWATALETAQLLDEDRTYYKQKLKQMEVDNNIWKDNAKDTMRELSILEDKMQNQKNEVEETKGKLKLAEEAATQAKISLEVEKAKIIAFYEKKLTSQQSNAQSLSNLEAIKDQVRKETEKDIRTMVEAEKRSLRDEIRHCEARIRSLESQLSLSDTQLARAIADSEAATARAKAKDLDMTELMKSIKDIQRVGQGREEGLNALRREAETRVTELEKALAQVNGSINLLTHEKATLKESLDAVKLERDEAAKALNDIRKEVDDLKTKFNSELSQLTLERELRARSEQKEHEERSERIALSAQMMAMTKEYAQMEAQLKGSSDVIEAKWRKTVDEHEENYRQKENELKASQEQHIALQVQIDALKQALQKEKNITLVESTEEMSKLKGELHVLKERLKMEGEKVAAQDVAHVNKIRDLETQIRDGQVERRRLHNLIQELRGNVRVFARIRPFLPNDNVSDDAQPSILAKGEDALKMIMPEDKLKYDFTFDRVFSPGIGQEAVFTEVSEFVQSALDGYNVCLFSYGQTGSGKTYTMQGFGTGQMRGIIPRAIEQVGSYKNQLERDGWRYDMQVSFLEIYNETIRDLLRDDGSDLLKHEVKVDAEGRRYVSDLTMVPLDPNDGDAVETVMRQAAKHRAVGSTDMNAVSSRSHSVFTLHLTAFHPEQRQALRGTLNLVDLAGSERLSRSNATGDRAKEAVAINKSLSALTDVFVAIGRKASHIPFRNSKLTYLLQPSLSGDGKTLMMVNLSPTEMSAQESLCSLRFAAQVNKCELGKAKRSLEDLDDDDAATIASEISARGVPTRTPLSTRAVSDVGTSTNFSSPVDVSKGRRPAATPALSSRGKAPVRAVSSMSSDIKK